VQYDFVAQQFAGFYLSKFQLGDCAVCNVSAWMTHALPCLCPLPQVFQEYLENHSMEAVLSNIPHAQELLMLAPLAAGHEWRVEGCEVKEVQDAQTLLDALQVSGTCRAQAVGTLRVD